MVSFQICFHWCFDIGQLLENRQMATTWNANEAQTMADGFEVVCTPVQTLHKHRASLHWIHTRASVWFSESRLHYWSFNLFGVGQHLQNRHITPLFCRKKPSGTMCCNGLSDLAILIRYRSRTLVCLSVCRMHYLNRADLASQFIFIP